MRLPRSVRDADVAEKTVLVRSDLNVPLEEVGVAFLDYVGAINNNLYETPRWYHGPCANCTTSFYRLPGSRVR